MCVQDILPENPRPLGSNMSSLTADPGARRHGRSYQSERDALVPDQMNKGDHYEQH